MGFFNNLLVKQASYAGEVVFKFEIGKVAMTVSSVFTSRLKGYGGKIIQTRDQSLGDARYLDFLDQDGGTQINVALITNGYETKLQMAINTCPDNAKEWFDCYVKIISKELNK